MDERARLVEALWAERRTEATRLAWALTGDANQAQELTQEAFVRLFIHRRRLRDAEAANAYLRRTIINLAYSHTRKRKRQRTHAEQVRTSPPAPTGELSDLHLDLVSALAALPERRRACIVLRYYLDLTELDTAAALGISVGTVKSQTHKALHQLRDHLELRPDVEVEDGAELPVARKDPS